VDDVRSGQISAAHADVNECGDKKSLPPLADETIAHHRAVLTLRLYAEERLTSAAAWDGMKWHSPRTGRAIRGRRARRVVGGPSGRVAIAAVKPAAPAMGVARSDRGTALGARAGGGKSVAGLN
jgi:hypothetical protein